MAGQTTGKGSAVAENDPSSCKTSATRGSSSCVAPSPIHVPTNAAEPPLEQACITASNVKRQMERETEIKGSLQKDQMSCLSAASFSTLDPTKKPYQVGRQCFYSTTLYIPQLADASPTELSNHS
jgi:hypothetical protein